MVFGVGEDFGIPPSAVDDPPSTLPFDKVPLLTEKMISTSRFPGSTSGLVFYWGANTVGVSGVLLLSYSRLSTSSVSSDDPLSASNVGEGTKCTKL